MISITVTTTLPEDIRTAVARLDAEMASVLQRLGVHVLERQRLHFEDKSRGGSGDDGQPWKPLTEATERKKALKGVRKNKARKDGTRKRKSLKGAVPKSQIGVDIGILRNCATPGYKATDGDGGNLFEIGDLSVTVGYDRKYATFFDEDRPLMPDPIPDDWRTECEQIVQDWAEDVFGGLSQ